MVNKAVAADAVNDIIAVSPGPMHLACFGWVRWFVSQGAEATGPWVALSARVRGSKVYTRQDAKKQEYEDRVMPCLVRKEHAKLPQKGASEASCYFCYAMTIVNVSGEISQPLWVH